jgi:hypothetical protein
MEQSKQGETAGIGSGIGGALGFIGSELFGNDYDEKALEALLGVDAEMGASAIDKMDPQARKRMLDVMESMYRTGSEGGMDAGAKLAAAQTAAQTMGQERAQRGAIEQAFGARGMNSSGAGLASQLAAQQGGAQANKMGGLQAASDARARAMQAMMGAGQMGGQIQGQNLQAAQAKDAVSQFNANQRLRKAGAISGAYGQKDKDEEDMYAGIGSGVGSAAGYAIGGK